MSSRGDTGVSFPPSPSQHPLFSPLPFPRFRDCKVDSSGEAQIELAPFCLIWQRQNNPACGSVGRRSPVKQLWVNTEEEKSQPPLPTMFGCSVHSRSSCSGYRASGLKQTPLKTYFIYHVTLITHNIKPRYDHKVAIHPAL